MIDETIKLIDKNKLLNQEFSKKLNNSYLKRFNGWREKKKHSPELQKIRKQIDLNNKQIRQFFPLVGNCQDYGDEVCLCFQGLKHVLTRIKEESM